MINYYLSISKNIKLNRTRAYESINEANVEEKKTSKGNSYAIIL